MINIRKLESELWESADLLRAGSKLISNQYCMPVLGLIFLRYAYSRFQLVEAEILKDRPMRGGWVLPVEASPWGLFGVANMFDFLDDVKKINPDLRLLGIVVTKVDMRKNYGKQTLETLRGTENVRVFDTYIRIDSEVEWAQDDSLPVYIHKKSARSAAEYFALAKEMDALCQ